MIVIENGLRRPDLFLSTTVDKFVNFVCSELSIYPRKIGVASYEIDDNVLGMCLDETDEDFILLIKEKDRSITDVFVTIAHEMVHVKQHMKENLGWFLDNRTDIPYHERWWEREATFVSIQLVEKFVETLKG